MKEEKPAYVNKMEQALKESYNHGFHDGYIKAREEYGKLLFNEKNMGDYLKQHGWINKKGYWWHGSVNFDFYSALMNQIMVDKDCSIIIKVK